MEKGEAVTGCGSTDVHFVFSRAICCLFLVLALAFDIPAPVPGECLTRWGATPIFYATKTLDVSGHLEKKEGGLV